MSLQIALQNQTNSNAVYAYITGNATSNNNALFLLQADGRTPYYPSSPSTTGAPLAVNCAIPLGAPGNTVYVTIPYLSAARLWFCVNNTLNFYLNPGPGLVEPSVTNTSDSNINKTWDFCEFTFNTSQLFANISYVDFFSLPVALTLTNSSNQTQHVSGPNSNALSTILSGLQGQTNSDGQPWASMNQGGIRALSPNSYITMNNGAFSNYFSSYVQQVWAKYKSTNLTIDTQAQWGTVNGQTSSDGSRINFPSGISFGQPGAADIFSCSTGPFAAGNGVSVEQLNIGARMAAALNRSVLGSISTQPDGDTNPGSQYYKSSPTNHYARLVHSTCLDGRGYAFPYDDVGPSGGVDQSGSVSTGSPQLWTVAVGGNNATASIAEASDRQTQLIKAMPKPAAPAAGGDKAAKPGDQKDVSASTWASLISAVIAVAKGLNCFGLGSSKTAKASKK